jgi:hypothetical protein
MRARICVCSAQSINALSEALHLPQTCAKQVTHAPWFALCSSPCPLGEAWCPRVSYFSTPLERVTKRFGVHDQMRVYAIGCDHARDYGHRPELYILLRWNRDRGTRHAYVVSFDETEELEHGFAVESVDGAGNAVFRVSLECYFRLASQQVGARVWLDDSTVHRKSDPVWQVLV